MSDLISRQALIAKIKDDGILGNGYSDSEREDDVIDMIESCEAVDAVPVVHGAWVRVSEDSNIFECSICKGAKHFNILKKDLWNYCPFCGAKMDGGKNES